MVYKSIYMSCVVLGFIALSAVGQQAAFVEENGIVVVECESVTPGTGWQLRVGSHDIGGGHTTAGASGAPPPQAVSRIPAITISARTNERFFFIFFSFIIICHWVLFKPVIYSLAIRTTNIFCFLDCASFS